MPPFVFLPQKSKILLPPIYRKNRMEHTVCETTKVNISNLLRGWQITRGLKGQMFKNPSLVNKGINLL